MKSKKFKIISLLVAIVVLLGMTTLPAKAAPPDQIEDTINGGLMWLVAQQQPGGYWNAFSQPVAATGLALYKLCDRAYELGYPSPFDPAYPYHHNVLIGFNYLFSHLAAYPIHPQDHTTGATGSIDDPDTRPNGIGIRVWLGQYTYGTGIALAAIAASGTPGRPNEAFIDYDGDSVPDTYGQVAQDMVDYLAFAQVDRVLSPFSGQYHEGGWDYSPVNNGAGGSAWKGDQSNSGYAVLGLAEAQDSGCTVPQWVKDELSWWVDWVQDDITMDPNDGGSWYSYPGDAVGVNILKAGNLIFEMALAGDTPSTPRVQDALDYLERHWNDPSGMDTPPGWKRNTPTGPSQLQAMFCTMKGLEYMGIDTFGAGPIDWFEEFSDALVAEKTPPGPAPGFWPNSSGRSSPVMNTEWALLTLQKVAPPTPQPVLCPPRGGYRWGSYSWDPFPTVFVGQQEVQFTNTGEGNAYNVVATVVCAPINVDFSNDPTVSLGEIPAGESRWSTGDTFELRVDMTCPQDPNLWIVWEVEYDDEDQVHHVVRAPKFCGETTACPTSVPCP